MNDESNGRCPNCGEDEMDPSTCKYCGWPDRYRGWEIDRDFMDYWRATHPDFDGESNTAQLSEPTHDALLAEIDTWIEEQS